MPDLYYGVYQEDTKPHLYVPGMRRIETKIFDSFKLHGLAPVDEKRHVANFWQWLDKKHTVLSWHDHNVTPYEFSVFIPALLDQRDALEYARTHFPEVMPSPITFRFAHGFGYDEALVYD